ncbi:MAG: hypothetical protein Q9191_006274 [Dirinaria sp. TL-2023a]
MNDDLDAAENGLSSGDSSFHKTAASADHRRAQKDSRSYKSRLYPPGTEYALCHAESQLMMAVVGVLNESLTESIKGFYKLRKAYITLDSIMDAEVKYVNKRAGSGLGSLENTSMGSLRSNGSVQSLKGLPGGFEDSNYSNPNSRPPSAGPGKENGANNVARAKAVYDLDQHGQNGQNVDNDEDEFYDADEAHDNSENPERYLGHLDVNQVAADVKGMSLNNDRADERPFPSPKERRPGQRTLEHDPESEILSHPIDIFIHSGSSLCFGLLLLLLSMIPPAFAKLLFIIGFRGDRVRGLRLLWQASKFHNINGAMAGLCLLGYYHAIVGFSDIIPDRTMSPTGEEPIEGYPKERCAALLADMRSRHPRSHLWLLEEAREESTNRHLAKAISLLSNTKPSPLKQVEALDMFEKSLNAMYIHDYELCTKSFVACVSLNNWSHALYYYIAGAAQVELYRSNKSSNPAVAATHAKKAIEYLKKAPEHAGKKKFMARQLPFDVFVTRKIKKWEARAHDFRTSFIDAIGVSPLEEMIFFWNGYKRMDASQLEDSLKVLAWSDDKSRNPLWVREGPDERAILALLRGTVLRNQHRWDEARKTLKAGVLDVDRAELKGGLKDDYTAPAAHYEMGVINWMQRLDDDDDHIVGPRQDRERRSNGADGASREAAYVRECEAFIDKAAKWESYELDARFGLKIATAQDTLAKWRKSRDMAVV